MCDFKPLRETETNKIFLILVSDFADKRYCLGRDGEKSENAIREISKLQLSLRKGKPYLLAQEMMFGRPRSSQEPMSTCVIVLQRHDKMYVHIELHRKTSPVGFKLKYRRRNKMKTYTKHALSHLIR